MDDDDNTYCDGPFWNTTQFMSGSWPRFSPCFQSIILVWVPCALLFLVSPFYGLWLRHRHVTLRLPFSRINAAKLTCQMSLIICTFTLLLKRHGQTLPSSIPLTVVEILADVIKMAAFMLLAAFGQYERKKGVSASMLQFFFWAVYSLGQTLPVYSTVKLKIYGEDPLGVVLFYGSFCLCLTLVILNSWSEHPGLSATRRGYMYIDEQDPCPLEAAATVSSLTFSWIFGLLRGGSKDSIDDSTMWAIPQDISSDVTSGRFDAVWTQQIDGHHSSGVLYSKNAWADADSGAGSGSVGTASSNSSTSNNSTASTNSYGGSIVSKATVMENTAYTERTRLVTKLESNPTTTYTQLLEHTAGPHGTKRGQGPRHIPSITGCLWRMHRTDMALIVITKLFGDALLVVVPLILRHFLIYLQIGDHSHRQWQGYGLSVMFLVTLQCHTVLSGRCQLLAVKTGLSVKTTLATAIYKKVLSLRRDKHVTTDTDDDALSLISEDCVRAQEFYTRLSHNITTPVLFAMAIVVTLVFAGPVAIIGVASLFLLVPFHILILLVQTEFKTSMGLCQNKRLRVLKEVVQGMKVLKLFAWERPFQSKLQALRLMEMTSFLKLAYCHIASGVIDNLSVYLASLVTCVCVLMYDDESPRQGIETIFMVLVYLSYLKKPLENTASFVHLSVQTYQAFSRMQTFLQREEIPVDAVSVTPGAEHPVMLEGAQMKWEDKSSFKLKNLTLTIPQESLVAVVGPEGCGKTSLLLAILGEMDRVRGNACRRGTVAYVPQDPWIQNATLRDNILFGKIYRERKVKAVVSACQLEDELTSLDIGEDTVIGRHGYQLDSRQERRVALARALYHDCDLYILDEPLMGLEPRLAGTVFNNVMGPKGLLKNATRIMSTNCVHLLPSVDMIVVMRQGRVVEAGSYEELMRHDGALVQFLKDRFMQDRIDARDWEDDDNEITSIKDDMWNRVERATTSEYTATSGDEDKPRQAVRDRATSFTTNTTHGTNTDGSHPNRQRAGDGNLEASDSHTGLIWVCRHYSTSLGRWSVACCCILFVLYQCSWALGNVWLSYWACDVDLRSNASTVDQRVAGNDFYITVFLLFGISQFLFLGSFHFLFWSSIVRASHVFYDVMIERLFRAPMTFFNATPLGNIMAAFSRDIQTTDHRLSHNTIQLISSWVQLVCVVIVITVTVPLFVVVLVPILAICVVITKLYLPASRRLWQLSLATQSPLHTHFCDTLSGATTIRAFHEEERFLKEFNRHMDRSNSYCFGVNIAHRWVVFHLSTLSNVTVFLLSIFQVISSGTDPGLAAVTIFLALQLQSLLGRLISSLANIGTDIVSLERIARYSEIPQEAEWEIPDNRVPATWPFPGDIEFQEFTTESEGKAGQLLTDVRVRIEGGEKVGVISRTQQDKASLVASLFRLVEGSKGTIIIDGVDISSIGLHDLRSRLTILPQDPVLFSGTIRYNLDPLSEFKDDEIWSSLGRVHLQPFVSQLADQLDFDVGDGGQHLSTGHRRLMWLARTLLRKTSILVVEEPGTFSTTPSDAETDHFIHNIIRMSFQSCTTITVTHRPQSVISQERVLVIEDGRMKEFDSPVTLLNNPASSFYSMARDVGLVA